MQITLNSSCSKQKDIVVMRPIDGAATLDSEYVKEGVWTSTIAIAESECDGNSEASVSSASVGNSCMQYSADGSGEGIMVQKTIAYDGGGQAVPYKQTIMTFMGAG